MPSRVYAHTQALLSRVKPTWLVERLRSFFAERSMTAYLVGGSVRDILMERPIHDLDIAVKGSSLEIGTALGRTLNATPVHMGHAHGLVRLVLPDQDGRLTVDISSFDGDIEGDLSRRDFTIDAMAIPLWTPDEAHPGLVDPLNGSKDLKQRLLRVVKAEAFKDDPARLLRGPRLAAQLAFSIEKNTKALIKRQSPLISGVTGERVRDELMKLLAAPNASKNLRLLDDLGLLRLLVPELEAALGVEQPKEHHWDVFQHCIETAGAVENVLDNDEASKAHEVLSSVPWHPSLDGYFQEEVTDGFNRVALLKFTGLLHDIAKPQTKTIEDSGRMRFFGHSEVGAKVAQEIMQRLRFSNRGISMVSKMIEHHLRPSQMAQRGELPTRRALFKYYRDMGEVAIDTLYLNLADYLAARGPNVDLDDWKGHCCVIGHVLDYALSASQTQSGYKLVNGHDIMQAFGLSSGRAVGELLKLVQEAQGAGEISTKDEALDLVRANLHLREENA